MRLPVLFSSVLYIVLLLITGCEREPASDISLADPNATDETRALFINLDRIRHDHVLFGHQDALAYGVHWIGEPGRSDVKDVTGSYPAVYGWELGDLELGKEENLDNVNFENMREWIREGYKRGGVITLSWHKNNPVSGGNAWDTTGAVPHILPGGEYHEKYKGWLDIFAEFVSGLTMPGTAWNDSEHLIPVIFRPFHEQSGYWFWWGDPYCTHEEYKQLWRFTVEYLRDEIGVRNILYAYSPHSLSEYEKDQYWDWYPGDEYIDILGFDDYFTLQSGYGFEDGVAVFTDYLKWIVDQAEARGKIPGLTETGLEAIPDPNWWTGKMLAAIKGDPAAKRIAYLLVWRNANHETDRQEHFYAPYPGHKSEEDFIRFRNDPILLFEDDLPILYQLP